MLKIYNTLTKREDEFKPIKEGEVFFYQCGPTVYWVQHIGNLRAMVLADLVRRSLEYLGFKVNFVRNYTDVGHLVSDEDSGEDKMAKGAQREGLSPQEIADKYIKVFEEDCAKLNILEPTYKPRATQYIKQMQDMISVLLEKGFAYATDLAIYFDISKAKDYTRLSGQKLEENKSGAGKGEVGDPQKKNPADFALWFFKTGIHKNALQFWASPFSSKLVENGEGFPGWHIECSVMSKTLLGDTFDIHMGGVEHIPVHHTNEIAQSESANGVEMAHYWIHNEHLVVDNKKMAKSEGTSYVLQDIIDRGYDPLVLRFFFLQAHYRSKQNFTWEALEAAQNGYKNLKNQILALGAEKGMVNDRFKSRFVEKIENDFNIPQALALVAELLKSDLSDGEKLATVLDFDRVFGLKLGEIVQEKVSTEIIQLAEDRKNAKNQKNYVLADEIRGKIEKAGYIIEDTKEGYKITKK